MRSFFNPCRGKNITSVSIGDGMKVLEVLDNFPEEEFRQLLAAANTVEELCALKLKILPVDPSYVNGVLTRVYQGYKARAIIQELDEKIDDVAIEQATGAELPILYEIHDQLWKPRNKRSIQFVEKNIIDKSANREDLKKILNKNFYEIDLIIDKIIEVGNERNTKVNLDVLDTLEKTATENLKTGEGEIKSDPPDPNERLLTEIVLKL